MEVIAVGVALMITGGVLFAAIHSFSVPVRALFVVHGDWLSEPNSGVTVHLPMLRGLISKPYGMLIITADGQQLVVPKEFEWLAEYVKERVLQAS